MKKLMTALAMCTVASLALAQVQSANVVGYHTKALSAGYNLYAPVFTTIGSNKVSNLNAIKGNFTEGDVVEFLDNTANQVAGYTWLLAADNYSGVDGWCDATPVVISTNIPQGVSLLIASQNPVNIIHSGEAADVSVPVNVHSGYVVVGNGTPTTRTLSQITFSGSITEGDVIEFLDNTANQIVGYTWLLAGDNYSGIDGWCDSTPVVVNPTITPGEGILLATQNGCVMTIPSPFN